MNKALLILLLIGFVAFASARFSNSSSRNNSNSSNSTNRSWSGSRNQNNNGNSRGDDRRPLSLRDANTIRNNATLLQENIDLYSALVTFVLNADENQAIIRNYTRRISNLVALIDLPAVREFVLGVADEAFSSLRTIRQTLRSELIKLNESNDPISQVNVLLDTVKFAAEEEFHTLKGYLIDALINITEHHKQRLSQADEETIADVRSLFEHLTTLLQDNFRISRRGLEDVRRVLNLQALSNRDQRTLRLENQIRLQVGLLLGHLRFRVSNLEDIVYSTINATFDRLHQLQQRVLDVSRRALDSHRPGNVLSEELLQLREGLGESLVNFQRNLEGDILDTIRNLIKSTRLRGTYGNSIEVLVRSVISRVRDRVESIRDAISESDYALRRRQYNY